MSIARTVYLRRTDMLTPQAWADAIRAAGFPMEMDTAFDVEDFSGFLPCRYDGESAGFEYFFSTTAQIGAEGEDDLPDVGDRDVGVSFVTHSSTRDLVAATIAAAVLCVQTGGMLYDEEAGELMATNEALAYARDIIDSVASELT